MESSFRQSKDTKTAHNIGAKTILRRLQCGRGDRRFRRKNWTRLTSKPRKPIGLSREPS